MSVPSRQDLIVIGVGSPLHSDDRVGLLLAQRLRRLFGAQLSCLERSGPAIELAGTIAPFRQLLILDAQRPSSPDPFTWHPLAASARATGGSSSHTFDWAELLALTRELYAAEVEAQLLAVTGERFELGEELSPRCAANAELAFAELVSYCAPR